jgi:hypothetical protein
LRSQNSNQRTRRVSAATLTYIPLTSSPFRRLRVYVTILRPLGPIEAANCAGTWSNITSPVGLFQERAGRIEASCRAGAGVVPGCPGDESRQEA